MKKSFFRLKFIYGSKKGFSLIELSVVISVAASAVVGFLAWTQPHVSTNASKAAITRTQMQDIQKAIDSFRSQKKRLPCPADPLMHSDNTRSSVGTDYLTPTGTLHDYYVNGFGLEDLDTAQTTVNGKTTYGIDCPVSVGAVPVFSLGLDESYINDAWGRRLTYHVANTLCGTDAGTETGISVAESQNTGCSTIDYQNNTGNIIVTNGTSTITSNAAYVVVSHGANGNGAFLPSGQKLSGGSANEIENSNGDTTYVKANQSATFDDIVVFETKNQIESATNRKSQKNISVADCEANSQALKNVTLTETGYMQSQLALTNYQQLGSNIGDQGLLGVLKSTQSICVAYYGTTATTINNQTWSGPQCPGNNNPAVNGSTYASESDTCSCNSGLWDGNCTVKAPYYDGMELWLDATDSKTLFTNSNCTTGISPANGATIGCWKDKSGNTNNATAGTAPTYTTNVTNNLPMLSFNGSSTYLNVDLSAMANIPYTIISVDMRANNNAASQYLLGTGYATANTSLHHGYRSNLSFTLDQWANGLDATITGYNTSFIFPTVAITSLDLSSGQSVYYYIRDYLYSGNSTQYTSSNSSTTPLSSANAGVIGRGFNSCCYYSGYIGEILIYKRSLSTNERTLIKSYISSKWGVSLP